MSAAESFVPEYLTPQPGEADSLANIISALRSATEALNVEAGLHLEQNDDAAAAALLLFDVRELRKALADVEASVEATAAQRMSGPTLDVPGFVVERKGGAKRSAWEHDRLAWRVCDDIAADETGTIDPARAEIVGAARDRILNAAGIAYWRTQQLRALGIDPSDFCQTEYGRRTVHVRKAVEDA